MSVVLCELRRAVRDGGTAISALLVYDCAPKSLIELWGCIGR